MLKKLSLLLCTILTSISLMACGAETPKTSSDFENLANSKNLVIEYAVEEGAEELYDYNGFAYDENLVYQVCFYDLNTPDLAKKLFNNIENALINDGIEDIANIKTHTSIANTASFSYGYGNVYYYGKRIDDTVIFAFTQSDGGKNLIKDFVEEFGY